MIQAFFVSLLKSFCDIFSRELLNVQTKENVRGE